MSREEELLLRFQQVFRGLHQQYRRLQPDLPVSGGEIFCLMVVDREGPLAPSDLVRSLGVTRAAVSSLLRRLIEIGFVTQIQDSHDHRRRLASLSTAGKAVVEEAREGRRAYLVRILGRLSAEEQEQLLRLLVKLEAVEIES